MTRLRELIDGYDECLTLRREIRAGLNGAARRAPRHLDAQRRPLHRDHGMALLSAAAAGLAIAACCAFWIGTAWSNGATAALMAAIFSCFFASQDNPVPGIMQFLTYTVYSIPLSALYLLGIMPAIHSFEMLALSMLPTAFVIGVFIARPASAGKAMAVLFGFVGTMALHDTNTADLVSFIDTQVAQIMGVGLAAVIAAIFRTVSADWSARRIQAANWRDLAALAASPRTQARHGYAARMLDRIGLLQPRLALAKRPDDVMAADALGDLRVGRDITELQRARRHLPMAEPVLRPCSTDWRATSAIARPGAAARRRRNSWRRSTARWPAWRARPPGRARPRGGGAGGHPPRLLPRRARVPTRPSPPGGPRIMIGEFNLYGIYFPGCWCWAWSRWAWPGPCAGCWPGRPVPAGGTRRCSTSRCSWCCFTASP